MKHLFMRGSLAMDITMVLFALDKHNRLRRVPLGITWARNQTPSDVGHFEKKRNIQYSQEAGRLWICRLLSSSDVTLSFSQRSLNTMTPDNCFVNCVFGLIFDIVLDSI